MTAYRSPAPTVRPMRRLLRTLLLMLLAAGLALGVFCYLQREQLARGWACYRVGSAPSFEEAQEEMAWFETGSDPHGRRRELVRKWGTGNRQFDLYLAAHVGEPSSSVALREEFSRELSRRPALLARWARCWSCRAEQEPDQQIAAIVTYLETLASSGSSKTITWREVLELQAVFELNGRSELAEGLCPANWHDRFCRWQEVRPAQLPHVPRPQEPLDSCP